MALNAREQGEYLKGFFEDHVELFEIVEKLAEHSRRSIGLRSVECAELMCVLAVVGELVDFGRALKRRGLANAPALKQRKALLAASKKHVPDGCDTWEDRAKGYREVHASAQRAKLSRNVRLPTSRSWVSTKVSQHAREEIAFLKRIHICTRKASVGISNEYREYIQLIKVVFDAHHRHPDTFDDRLISTVTGQAHRRDPVHRQFEDLKPYTYTYIYILAHIHTHTRAVDEMHQPQQTTAKDETEVAQLPFDASRILAPAQESILPFPPEQAKVRMDTAKATVMFEKSLTQSDTSGGGRVVIPKAIAEKHFPKIDDTQGCVVPVVDVFGVTRGLRFRYWVNNNSRMYILEGTGALLKLFKLGVGDVLIFGKDEQETIIICGRKGTKQDIVRRAPATSKKSKRRADELTSADDRRPMMQLPVMGGVMSPAVRSRTISNDEADLQAAYNYWEKLSFPPKSDGVFRAVPMERLREPDAVSIQYGMYCSTVTIAGEQYQAFFDSREAAEAALTVSMQSIL
jgi:bifunctional DNA-binding transcriptional regulator/antitoxin component of YhaV-PrlF toxin-antitoxin module